MGHVYLKKVDQPLFVSDDNIKIIADALDSYLKTKEDVLLKIGNEFIKVSEVRKLGNDGKSEETKEEYSKDDLHRFHKEIAQYLIDDRLSMKSEMQLLKDKNLIRCEIREGCKGVTISDFDWAIYQSSVGEYQAFLNKLDAWKDWRGKIDYAKKMDARELDKLAQGMKL